MSKDEFDKRFSQTFSDAMRSMNFPELIQQELKKSANENGKISYEDLASSILLLSIQINKKVMQSVLSDFLQIDQ